LFESNKLEKSNFYEDLERVLEWVDPDKKIEKQNENDVKQKRE
jgi:hypothetical protein